MNKYYKVIKDNFLWEEGAIISNTANSEGGYIPIDPAFIKHENNATEYITAGIIENSPETFERVYPVNLATKTIYKSREEARELLKKFTVKED